MMMKITYTITITGMRETQMRPILAALKETKLTYELEADVDVDAPAKLNGTKYGKRMSPATPLILTGKTAQKGSQRERILLEHEKLEKKHGIGSVTRRMLNKQISGLSIDTTVVGQLIKGGFLQAN